MTLKSELRQTGLCSNVLCILSNKHPIQTGKKNHFFLLNKREEILQFPREILQYIKNF